MSWGDLFVGILGFTAYECRWGSFTSFATHLHGVKLLLKNTGGVRSFDAMHPVGMYLGWNEIVNGKGAAAVLDLPDEVQIFSPKIVRLEIQHLKRFSPQLLKLLQDIRAMDEDEREKDPQRYEERMKMFESGTTLNRLLNPALAPAPSPTRTATSITSMTMTTRPSPSTPLTSLSPPPSPSPINRIKDPFTLLQKRLYLIRSCTMATMLYLHLAFLDDWRSRATPKPTDFLPILQDLLLQNNLTRNPSMENLLFALLQVPDDRVGSSAKNFPSKHKLAAEFGPQPNRQTVWMVSELMKVVERLGEASWDGLRRVLWDLLRGHEENVQGEREMEKEKEKEREKEEQEQQSYIDEGRPVDWDTFDLDKLVEEVCGGLGGGKEREEGRFEEVGR